MKVSANFSLQEFIDPVTYSERGEKSLQLIDNRIISIAQFFRDIYGGVTINNWHSGGSYKESGLRRFDTSTGAKYSQHKYGRAIDLKFSNKTAQQVYADIMNDKNKFFNAGLRVVENIQATPSWLHLDVRNTGLNDILIVNP